MLLGVSGSAFGTWWRGYWPERSEMNSSTDSSSSSSDSSSSRNILNAWSNSSGVKDLQRMITCSAGCSTGSSLTGSSLTGCCTWRGRELYPKNQMAAPTMSMKQIAPAMKNQGIWLSAAPRPQRPQTVAAMSTITRMPRENAFQKLFCFFMMRSSKYVFCIYL